MKILYAALKHDPTNPDLASGVDYNFYSAFCKQGAKVSVVGPFTDPPVFPERVLRRLHRIFSKRRGLKWDISTMRRAASRLNQAEGVVNPDVVFSIFPPPLAGYSGLAPCVFNTDTTFQGWQEGGARFGKLALEIMVWVEKRAFARSEKILVFSDWCRSEIVRRHGVSREKILVHPMPCALPIGVIPGRGDSIRKSINLPLKLLLVGRDWVRKGIPTAIAATRQLNDEGIPTELTICGVSGEGLEPRIEFVGPYKKSIPEELERYVDLYRWADLLIHPAIFDPSPIVPAEAAAFGVPTISNDVGGISTSVEDGKTGIVLPSCSAGQVYATEIKKLIRAPDRYAELSRGARLRYEREQNWDVAGQWAMKALEDVTKESARQAGHRLSPRF